MQRAALSASTESTQPIKGSKDGSCPAIIVVAVEAVSSSQVASHVALFAYFLAFAFGLTSLNDLMVNQQIVEVELNPPDHRNLGNVEKKGLLYMRNQSVTIVGLARNAASKLPSVLRQVEILSEMFRNQEPSSQKGTPLTIRVKF